MKEHTIYHLLLYIILYYYDYEEDYLHEVASTATKAVNDPEFLPYPPKEGR